MADAVKYEELVEAFERNLVSVLRGHSADVEYLEMWVPDENHAKSILNMVEAAQAFGREEISIRVSLDTAAAIDMAGLKTVLSCLGQIEIEFGETGVLIHARKL